jgi:hypothetical protein
MDDDTFVKIILLFFGFIGLFAFYFQVRIAKKKGLNWRDEQVLSKIMYRSMPIAGIAIFFLPDLPWKWKIVGFIIYLIGLVGYVKSMANGRKLFGTAIESKKDQADIKSNSN